MNRALYSGKKGMNTIFAIIFNLHEHSLEAVGHRKFSRRKADLDTVKPPTRSHTRCLASTSVERLQE